MGKIQCMLKDAFSLILKLGLIALVLLGIWWFMQEGTVLLDQGKKHGIMNR